LREELRAFSAFSGQLSAKEKDATPGRALNKLLGYALDSRSPYM
jgi:hypothetical protein